MLWGGLFVLISLLAIKRYFETKSRPKSEANESPHAIKNSHAPSQEIPLGIFDTSSNPPFPLRGYLFTIFLAGLGLAVFLTMEEGYPRYKTQSTLAAWPTTPGVVERSDVIERPGHYANTDAVFQARIVVRYTVGGVDYKIHEAYLGQSEVWRDNLSAHGEASRYSAGDRVQVHYSPDDPSIAAIETDFRILTLAFCWFAILEGFALLSLYSSLEQHWRFIKSRRVY